MPVDLHALIEENKKVLEKLTEDGSKQMTKLLNQMFKIGYYKGVRDLLGSSPKSVKDDLSIKAAGLVRLIQDADLYPKKEKTKSSDTE